MALNADLLFTHKTSEGEIFNGPLMLVLLALATVSTLLLYYKAAFSDPGFVKVQVFHRQETELPEEDAKNCRHARKPSTVLEELDGLHHK